MRKLLGLCTAFCLAASGCRSVAAPPDLSCDGFVAGSAAYLQSEHRLIVLDVSNPAAPREVSAFELPGTVSKVCVGGGLAFVTHAPFWEADGRLLHGGLRILSVSDPWQPAEIGQVLYEGDEGFPGGVAVGGRYAYLADWAALRVIDISDLAAPRRAAQLNVPAREVALAGDFAYAAWDGCGPRSLCNGRLTVVDISDPLRPTEVVSYTRPLIPVDEVALVDRYALLAMDELVVLDFFSPAIPREVARLKTDPPTNRIFGLEVAGEIAYLVAPAPDLNRSAVYVVDIAAPRRPAQIAVLPLPEGFGVRETALAQTHLYVSADGCVPATSECGAALFVLDVSDPTQPKLIGEYFAPFVFVPRPTPAAQPTAAPLPTPTP